MGVTVNLKDAKMWQMKKSLYAFVKEMWSSYETAEFVDLWLLEYLSECFMYSVKHFLPNYVTNYWITDDEYEYIKAKTGGICDVRDKKINGQPVHNHDWNMPPRHSKSSILNICGPTWLELNTPITVANVSHSGDLSATMNNKRKKLINSDKFKYYFSDKNPSLRPTDMNTVKKIRLASGGELYSVCQTSFTGFGADVIICDDLISADNARKDGAVLRNAVDFYRKTLPTRLNTKKTGVIWNIQQRIANGDITGTIREDKDLAPLYSHTSIQAIATEDCAYVFPCSGKVKIIKKGEYLWPERFGDYSSVRAEVGEDEFETQYQQDASASNDNIIKSKYIHWISEKEFNEEIRPYCDTHYASHDCPVKDKESNDYLGYAEAYAKENELIITDAWQDHLNYIKTKQFMQSLEIIDPGILQVIEDKANGAALLQDLSGVVNNLIPFSPKMDSKSKRLEIASPYIQSGAVRFLETERNKDAVKTLLKFPFLLHDDVVDAISQLIIYHYNERKLGVYTNSFTYKNVVDDVVVPNTELQWAATMNGEYIKVLGVQIIPNTDTYVAAEEKLFTNLADFEFWIISNNIYMILDASYENRLSGLVNTPTATVIKFNDNNMEKSIQLLRSGFYNGRVKVCKSCNSTKTDISRLKISKQSQKVGTEKMDGYIEGYAGCLRAIVTYNKGINSLWY